MDLIYLYLIRKSIFKKNISLYFFFKFCQVLVLHLCWPYNIFQLFLKDLNQISVIFVVVVIA